MSKEIPFYKATINETQKKLISEVLSEEPGVDSKVTILEEAFVELTGASYAVATSNATSAMHLSLCAIDLKRGDKVLCSVNAFPSVPEVVRHFDAEPVFIDINANDYNMNLDELEKYLEKNNSKKLKAVIVTHVAGQALDLDRLYSIAQIYDVKIVEDASEAMGATYDGQIIGSTGADVVIYSFHPHLKNEAAHGGIMVCEDDTLYERALLLRNHAIPMPDEDEDEQLSYIYDVVDIGCQYKLSELNAAYCLGALENLTSAAKRRADIAKVYQDKLGNAPHIALPEVLGDHSFNLYIIKIDKNRDSFARKLKEKGIETGLHYIPLHLLTYYKTKYSLRVNAYPVALQTYQQILSIPIYEGLSDADVTYICDTILDLTKTLV
ncbi:MAG: DegT/DnrJ/EryC1/StrS aminotransferase family protein [Thiovulaceae bacterium]|nr:DegT/DnrJ/EryC1/StrS aminotransferase family protein [Sulfurimonadaceae bacterium]